MWAMASSGKSDGKFSITPPMFVKILKLLKKPDPSGLFGIVFESVFSENKNENENGVFAVAVFRI